MIQLLSSVVVMSTSTNKTPSASARSLSGLDDKKVASVLKSMCVCFLLFSLFATSSFGQTEDERLASFFKAHLDETFQLRPLDATMLGDHRFDHLLDDISEVARRGWLENSRQQLVALEQSIDSGKLSRSGQIDFEIFRDELVRRVWLTEHTRPFEEDPRVYGGYINDSIYSLLTQSTLPREENIKNAISRMAEIPRIVATAKITLDNPPRSVLETAIGQNKGSIGFYEKGVFELVGDTPQHEKLRQATLPVIETLKDYQTFLESDLLPRANGDWRLGKSKFAAKLELVLDLNRTADQLLNDAEGEFVRVQGELYVIARQLWSRYFPKLILPPDDERGRRETIAMVTKAVSQEHGQPAALIGDARATVKGIQAFIRQQDILRLPASDRCQVIEMPEFRRGNSLAYLESALPLDPNGDSFYAVSPPPSVWDASRVKSFLEEYNRHMLQILTIHEAYPGHYVQLEYSNRSPSLIRRVLQSGVFVEGWAVYTEQMMLDQGYGEGSLPLRLNQLKFYLRAVANTILDYKMHCTEMSDQEALAFLTQEAYQSEGEARLKIIRAKQSSVQLSTYFAGRMAHYRLRQQIQREQTEAFDLGRYHEAVLDHGSVPVKFLPELVRERLKLPR
ncbi:MAG: DUF885 domain-containing protein [Pirellulaceae bacterium]|nr:DUF885 domain-containing protein [Pirellulaceae bacterium]